MAHLESFLRNPIAFAIRAVKKLTLERWKYATQEGYDAEQYWGDRFKKYGLNLRGPGHDGQSIQENELSYHDAERVFRGLCHDEGIDFKNARVMEIGCATGFYAGIFQSLGSGDYMGIDVTDVLFPELQKRFERFRFAKTDISLSALPREPKFNVATLIDVAQHIVTRPKFEFALGNIDQSLAPRGKFIFSADLEKSSTIHAFYETQWVVDDFRKCLPHHVFSPPRRFRDKYLVCSTKQ